MTDKKLTYKEIIKALECCGKLHIENIDSFCNECIFKGKAMCIGYLCDNSIDLINRLQEENERLKTEKDNLIRTYSECQIANLQEFMHRAENKLANNTDISMVGYQSVICDMEEAYKELAGDSNAKEKE